MVIRILNKSDNSPIEHARKSPNLRTTQMSHGVTNPFIGAFRYIDMLKSGFLSLTIQSEKETPNNLYISMKMKIK